MIVCDCGRKFPLQTTADSCRRRGHIARLASHVKRPYIVVFLDSKPTTLVLSTCDSAARWQVARNWGLTKTAVISRADHRDLHKVSRIMKLDIPKETKPWMPQERKAVWKHQVLL